MDVCINNPEKSSTAKINEHEMCGYSIVTQCSFDEKRNNIDYYRSKDCFKKFCKDLRKQAKLAVDYKQKDINTINRRRKL